MMTILPMPCCGAEPPEPTSTREDTDTGVHIEDTTDWSSFGWDPDTGKCRACGAERALYWCPIESCNRPKLPPERLCVACQEAYDLSQTERVNMESTFVPLPLLRLVMEGHEPEPSLVKDMASDLLAFWRQPILTWRAAYAFAEIVEEKVREEHREGTGCYVAINPILESLGFRNPDKERVDLRYGDTLKMSEGVNLPVRAIAKAAGLPDKLVTAAEAVLNHEDHRHSADYEAGSLAAKILEVGGPRAQAADAARLKKMGLKRSIVPRRIELDPKALEVEYIGEGGVNEEPTGVKLTHLPTGIVMASSLERSRIANQAKALSRLTEAVIAHWREKMDNGLANLRDAADKISKGDRE